MFDGVADVLEFGVEEFADVSAGDRAFITELGDPAYLVEGEPGRLGVPDEYEAVECMVVVLAVSARGSCRFAKQPEPFVEANGPRVDANALSDFTDSHRPKVPLDLLLRRKV